MLEPLRLHKCRLCDVESTRLDTKSPKPPTSKALLSGLGRLQSQWSGGLRRWQGSEMRMADEPSDRLGMLILWACPLCQAAMHMIAGARRHQLERTLHIGWACFSVEISHHRLSPPATPRNSGSCVCDKPAHSWRCFENSSSNVEMRLVQGPRGSSTSVLLREILRSIAARVRRVQGELLPSVPVTQ